MFRRLLRSWVFWILMLLGLSGFVAWLATRPIAKVRLSDGSTLIFRRVTYGKEHPYRPPHVAHETVREWIATTFAAKERIISREDSTVLHFGFGRSPFSDQGVSAPKWVIVFITPNLRCTHVEKINKDFPPVTTCWGDLTNWGLTATTLASDRSDFFVANPITDRRRKNFEVELAFSDRREVVTLPNPFYRDDWPTWAAETFPVRRNVGDFTLVMKGWRNGKQTAIEPDLEYLWRGTPVEAVATFHYTDATGQQSEFPALPTTESAWKVSVRAKMGDTQVLAERKTVWVTGTPPAAGRVKSLIAPDEAWKVGNRSSALVGEGTVGVRGDPNGELPLGMVNRAAAVTATSNLTPNPIWEEDFRTGGPGLAVGEYNRSRDLAKPRPTYAVKGSPFGTRDIQALGGDGVSGENLFRFSEVPLETSSPGAPLRIRSYTPTTVEAEFTVAPPQPAGNR